MLTMDEIKANREIMSCLNLDMTPARAVPLYLEWGSSWAHGRDFVRSEGDVSCFFRIDAWEAPAKVFLVRQSIKLYEKKVYIPINKFFEEDYPIIFTKKFIRKLQDSEPTYAVEDFDDQKIYEVIITTSNPGEPSLGHEGGLHLFQFVKTNKGYKFWGIDTIP